MDTGLFTRFALKQFPGLFLSRPKICSLMLYSSLPEMT